MMDERVVLISRDCHAALPVEQFREHADHEVRSEAAGASQCAGPPWTSTFRFGY
jgi:hypothetical protein